MGENIELTVPEMEPAAINGHDDTWKVFKEDDALLQHILSRKLAEEIIEMPEWDTKVLCRALNADTRIKIQIAAYDDKTKRVDYRQTFHMLVTYGCLNPETQNKIFTGANSKALMQEQDGGAIERIALTILRLSSMLPTDMERARKN